MTVLHNFVLHAQTTHQTPLTNKRSAYNPSPATNTKVAPTPLPFNRLLQSAGQVITYGDPRQENHTLDLALLPDKRTFVVEDRYGIALLSSSTPDILFRWSFSDSVAYKDLMSTYSGICTFLFGNRTYIAWSAATGSKAMIMIAEWDGLVIKNVEAIKIPAVSPAATALPNAIAVRFEPATPLTAGGSDSSILSTPSDSSAVPYLYAVLNGNNQCLKIRFTDKSIVWTANTGVAPFGICILHNKAYVTNWGGALVTDTSREYAGTPWGSAYTNPVTGATANGSLSVIDLTSGAVLNELPLGLHPTAIIHSPDDSLLYVANGNSDYISVVNVNSETVVDSIDVGLYSKQYSYYGSSPGALQTDSSGSTLYVANGLDNAVAVISLADHRHPRISGYIPTEAYPSGIVLSNNNLYVTNLEAKGAGVLADASKDLPAPRNPKPAIAATVQAATMRENSADTGQIMAYSIHRQLASLSVIPVPTPPVLARYTAEVRKLSLFYRIALTNRPARTGRRPLPVPERIGEPSLFRHVIYIVKENKTYDQVYGDLKQGRGMSRLCIFGDSVTPNQHRMASDFPLLDNYFASGKCSAEGHQWVDAAMVSDYIERNVRAWFRSYPHRQEDALVYNKTGLIWNNALDHGKKVRIYGEACLTHYDTKQGWFALFDKYMNRETIPRHNTSTIARIRPVISADYPDCDNIAFTDQLRADVFIEELNKAAAKPGDSLPDFMELSLPDDHTAGTSPNFPTPRAMVADNDLALGRIVEAVSHSRFWDSTVIFVTEDDSQSGWDHISPYRTTCLVISPYSHLNKTIHTNYNQTSMVRTIEQILGIPPMNIIDATALPMFDCFSNTRSVAPYHLVSNKIPLREMNRPYSQLRGKALQYAKLSANSAFKEVDGGDDSLMNRILWFAAKGPEKYPSAGN